MPKRISWLDQVQDLATSQDGLVTSAQLVMLGSARSTISYRNRNGGMWNRVLPGVHALTPLPLTERQRLRAALLYAGDAAILTGQCCLPFYGLGGPTPRSSADQVHVLIGHTHSRQSSGFVQIERTTRLPEPVECEGLRISPLPRAICDAARASSNRLRVFAQVTDAVARGLATSADLRQELLLGQRRGSAFLRQALEHAESGTWSGPEADLRRVILSSDLPEPRWNVLVSTHDGGRVAILDALWDDVWLGLEVNSRAHHSESSDWHDTLDRASRLAAFGVVLIHVTPTRIQRDPRGVLTQIRMARANLRGRPLPELIATRAPRPHTWGSNAEP